MAELTEYLLAERKVLFYHSERPKGVKNLGYIVRDRLPGVAEILRRSLRSLLRMTTEVVVLTAR